MRTDIIAADEERRRSLSERLTMIVLEVAIGAMAAALLAVPVLMAVTGKSKTATGDPQSR
ncbi:hypothetical protein NF700_03685 [Sphingomonadaceae bacterium OTU29MARTA1]|nr:hypothetical protein NF700_03685 [Sphingomonadaceae bacterium OTU29MARTA1]